MKSLIVCVVTLALLAGLGHSAQFQYRKNDISSRIFEDVINGTLEKIRQQLPNPIVIPTLDLNLPEGGPLVGNASVSNLEAYGLNGFKTTDLALSVIGMKLNFTLLFPSININSDYFLGLLLAELVPLYGAGRANINLRGLEVTGTGKANLTGGLSVSDIKVLIDMNNAVFDIHGALNNEDFSLIMSSILNDVVTGFFNEHKDLISNVLSPIVQALINGILKGGNNNGSTTPANIPENLNYDSV